jgi:predicted Zn-dependent peptidase
VRGWFTDHYAPNNAVLVLSGDVDVATARPLVEKYYGDIPSGPAVKPVVAGPVTLPATLRREMTDQVATTRLLRVWSGPNMNDPEVRRWMSACRCWGAGVLAAGQCAGARAATGRLGQRRGRAA